MNFDQARVSTGACMSNSSEEKVLFLKQKLDASCRSITLAPENTRLNEKLAVYEQQFNQLLEQMRALRPDELIDQTHEDWEIFLRQIHLNRGDHDKSRFLNRSLEKRACIEDQVSRLTKNLIESIEDENLNSELTAAFRQHGIYQILYHHGVMGHYKTFHPCFVGDEFPPLGPMVMNFAKVGLGFVALSLGFFASAALLGLSGGWIIAATALFGAAVVYMAGLLYGIMNDIFATKANLPYFLLGHQYGQFSFFISNDPLVQAIGWGIIASQPIAIIAALVFGITIATVMASAASPPLIFILAILELLVPPLVLCVNAYANYSANQYIKNGISLSHCSEEIKQEFRKALNLAADAESIDLDEVDFDSPSFRALVEKHQFLNDYQLDGLALMSSSKKDKANWLANGNRNLLGYLGAPTLAIASLVLMLTLKAVPAIFFSPLFAVIIPLLTAVLAMVGLATALYYVTVNDQKQIDNRYKLRTYESRKVMYNEASHKKKYGQKMVRNYR